MKIKDYFEWLKRDWAKAGLVLAIYLFVMLFVFVREQDYVIFLLLLHTPLYMLHETEEYLFPGGFLEFFNRRIFGFERADKPLDETFSFVINVGLVWILLPLCALLAMGNLNWGLWVPYFSIFAGLSHLALGIRAKQLYNPGLVVSLLLNIPVGIWTAWQLAERGVIANPFFNGHLLVGLVANLLLPVMGVIVYRRYRAEMQAA